MILLAVKRYSPATWAYVIAVVAVGAIGSVSILATARFAAWRSPEFVFFLALVGLASLLYLTYSSSPRGRGSISASSAFAFPLFFLVDPSACLVAFHLMILADWVVARRSLVPGLFNLGQYQVSLFGMTVAWRLLRPESGSLVPPTGRALLAALVPLLVCSLLNHGLTNGALALSSGHRYFATGFLNRTTFYNEAILLSSGLTLVFLWLTSPALAVIGSVPILALFLILKDMHLRGEALEDRRADLASLQELGLRIGSELRPETLRPAIVRTVREALGASGAVLWIRRRIDPLALAASDLAPGAPAPPESLALTGLASEALEGRETLLRRFDRKLRPGAPFEWTCAESLLLRPIRLFGEPAGLLLAYTAPSAGPFTEKSRDRLEILSRFVDVSLANARLYADLTATQEQLLQAEKLSAVGQLVSGIAHELNNPLAVILGYAELLTERTHDGAMRGSLSRIVGETNRAATIVRNLVRFSRPQHGPMSEVDLNAVVRAATDARSPHWLARRIRAKVELAPSLPAVKGDAAQLQQVVLNLLINAEYAVEKREEGATIRVATGESPSGVFLSISDNGHGIRSADMPSLFTPFFTTRAVGRGTGLGLSICYGIVRDHGGSIRAESREGEGATFIIELPVAPGEPPDDAADAGNRAPAGPRIGARQGA